MSCTKIFGGQKMATQLDFEKRKKRIDQPSEETVDSQILFPPTPDKKLTQDVRADQTFCVFCGCYHKPNAKLRCAFNRAITKIEVKTVRYRSGK
jgi:hypothetical protein